MKPTIPLMLMALLLVACGPLRRSHIPESEIPGLGSLGKYGSGLFKRDFQKIGEPVLQTPVAVSVRSIPFSKRKLSQINKYRESVGIEPLIKDRDSGTTVELRYFEARFVDIIGLITQLNKSDNLDFIEYIKEDKDLVLLTRISFVTDSVTAERFKPGKPLYLSENPHGALKLVLGNGPKAQVLDLSDLQVFDFGTSGFCWKKDHKGRYRIAQISEEGAACPGETVKDPKKLETVPYYLKP